MSPGRQKAAAALLGLAAVAIVLELGLQLTGAVGGAMKRAKAAAAPIRPGEVRLLCLGDSMTAIGGYPAALEAELNRGGGAPRYAVIDRGQASIGLDYIAEHLDENLERHRPDAVILMIGRMEAFYRRPPQRRWWWSFRLGRLIATTAELLAQTRGFGDLPTLVEGRGEDWGGDADAGEHYFLAGDYRKAAAFFRHAAGGAKAGPLSRLEAAARAMERGDAPAARETLRRAAEESPQDRRLLRCAYWLHNVTGDEATAERLMRRAAAMPGADWSDLSTLSYLHLSRGSRGGAKELQPLLRASGVADDRLLRAHAVLSLFRGDEAEARFYFAKADALEAANAAATAEGSNAYRGIAERILARKLVLFSMQYPARRVAPLKASLAGLEGVRFVDNEALFKDALRTTPFTDLFLDQYGGDFGHLKPKGVSLLARHLAAEIRAAGLKPREAR
ncbi:MAG: hypothetical protein HYX59_13610 [Elusimicrobia bacterium]|nr:hypothetical protein [Elusimicrobiota bacterium]